MASRKNGNRKRPLKITGALAAVIVLVLSLLITFVPEAGLPSWSELFGAASSGDISEVGTQEGSPFSVYYLDVGQADCELILCSDSAVLIDAGDVDAFPTIDAFLKSKEVKTIQYFILSHAHADHIGSADEVLENYTVENVILPKYTEENMPASTVYEDLLTTLSDFNGRIIAAAPGNTYELPEFRFTVLAPNADYKELNDTSVVVRAVYGKTAFLFQGDAEKKSEQAILDLGLDVRADVIKLGHHGSTTSSTETYLQAVSPKFAVISCGENNSYNLPSQTILKRLDSMGIDYRRTDLNGTITVHSDGHEISVETER